MSASMEDRLRAALQAKAAQVTDDRLLAADSTRAALTAPDDTPSDVSRIEPGVTDLRTTRHARWFAPSLAVAAVALVAVAATVITSSVQNSSPAPVTPAHSSTAPAPSSTPTPTPSVTHSRTSASPTHTAVTSTHTAVAPPAMLGNGRQGARSAVPWSEVGTGWTVALWTPDTASSSESQALQTAPERLYLVDPLGGRYLITELPANTWQLEDFSGDGHRALLLRYVQSVGSSRLAEVNLQTGALGAEFDPGPNLAAAQYTKPLGTAIEVVTPQGLRKVDLTGHQELYSTAITAQPLYSPDGLTQLVGTTKDLRLFSNAGTLVRTVGNPPGRQYCVPVRWSTPTVAVVNCSTAAGDVGVWLVPIDGSAPSPMAVQDGAHYTNAALFGSDLFAQTSFGAPCTGSVGSLDGTTFTRLTLPGDTDSNQVAITGLTASSIRISLKQSCRQTTLLSYDPATGQSTVLLGGSLNGGTILGSVLFHATDPKD